MMKKMNGRLSKILKKVGTMIRKTRHFLLFLHF